MSDVDLWADDVLADPYPAYAGLRALGSVVWLSCQEVFVLPGFHAVRDALADHATFSSGQGVGVDAAYNARSADSILTSDPPLHDAFRRVLNPQLIPRALRTHEDKITMRAEDVVEKAVAKGEFDAFADLAQPYTVELLADLVGLPSDGREHLLRRSTEGFDTFGPANARMRAGLGGLREMVDYCQHAAGPEQLAPDGWGAEIHAAAASGAEGLAPDACRGLMLAYLWAGMDTTVNAVASAVWLFANNPAQWDLVRADDSLVAGAFNEVLRMQAPVQRFTRCTTADVSIDDVVIPAGSRVLLLFGSASRDGTHYPDPDRFDVTRNPVDHLSFGRGIHRCVGAPLALLEGHAVIRALVARVARIDEIRTTWRRNNALHGPELCQVRVHRI